MNVTNQMRQRILLGGALTLFVVLLLSVPLIVSVSGQPVPPSTTTPTPACAQIVHFYAYDVVPENNGPAAVADPNNVAASVNEFVTRMKNDPALLAQVQSYLAGTLSLSSTQALLDATNAFMANPKQWCDTLGLIVAGLAQCSSSIEDMSGPYQTWYMQKTQPVPTSYPADPDRPSYKVLRFSCPNGIKYNFKLDCGFQPVDQFPPAAPPGGPPPSQPGTPPNVPRPPVTTPPNTTTTTNVCPPQGCKPYVPPAPHQCADPAQPCQPGQGPAIPNPPDPVKPTTTVTPPSSVLPPPAPTVAPRPTHTATVPSPSSVPS